MHDAICPHVGIFIHVEDDTIGQLLFIGAQRADKIAQPFGKHRNSAIHQVNTRGTLLRFLVYHTSFRDIIAYVSDMDTHLPQSVLQLLYRQSVIEVLGVFRVYGASEDITEVFPLGKVLWRNLA